jgi:hypothetical protein
MKTLDAQGAKLTADEKVAVDKTGTDTRYGADLVYTNYTGEVGNSRHVTRREYGDIPLAAITTFRGMMGENPHDHYDASPPLRWAEFLCNVEDVGILSPIFVNVGWCRAPGINEGNHRTEAARVLGLKTVPIEIAYFGHAEDQGTVMDRYIDSL